MGQAEDQYLERMRAALLPDTLGTGRVEPSSEKIAADHSLGRSTGFLTEKQPTMQAAAKGALIGGSLGSLAATGFSLASRKIHTPDAQYARGKAKHIGAALGSAVGAGIGSIKQRRSGYKSHDEPLLRGAAAAGALTGVGTAIKHLGLRRGAVPRAALLAGIGATAALGVTGTVLAAARAIGRRRIGQSGEKLPSAGAAGSVASLAALGAHYGKNIGTRQAVKTIPGNKAVKDAAKNIFARKTWASVTKPFTKKRRVAKAFMHAQQSTVRSFHAGHFRPIERRAAGTGALVGAGLALGLLATESRRRKNQKKTDDPT